MFKLALKTLFLQFRPIATAMRIGNWETVRLFLWGEEPSTKQEKKLLLKIDWFILSYCCLMVRLYRVHGPSRTHVSSNSTLQIVRQHIHFRLITTVLGRPVAHGYLPCLLCTGCLSNRSESDMEQCSIDLDRSNVSNAYVSGMKEDLHMVGTDFNVSSIVRHCS